MQAEQHVLLQICYEHVQRHNADGTSAHRDMRRQVVQCDAVVEECGEQLDGLPGDDPGLRKNK